MVTATGAAVTGLSSDKSIANCELWKAAPLGRLFLPHAAWGKAPGAKSCGKVERARRATKRSGREDGDALLCPPSDRQGWPAARLRRGAGQVMMPPLLMSTLPPVSEGSPAGVRSPRLRWGGGQTGCDRDRAATRWGEARSLLGDALTAVSLQRWRGQISRLRRDAVRDNAALRLTSIVATSFGVGRPQVLVLVRIGRAPGGRRTAELTSDSDRG